MNAGQHEHPGVKLLLRLFELKASEGAARLESDDGAVIVVAQGDLVEATYRGVRGLSALFAAALSGTELREAPYRPGTANLGVSSRKALQELERVLVEDGILPPSRPARPTAGTPELVQAEPEESWRAIEEAPTPTSTPAAKPSNRATPSTQPATQPMQTLSPGLSALPKVGDAVGRCLVTEEVARGGSCVVYRAIHHALQVNVALKVMTRRNGDFSAEHFAREARLLARLNHPNLVRILDFEDRGEHPYLVLEYVDGLSLRELIRHSGALQPDRAVKLALGIVDALEYVLGFGVCHRDLKPANVLIGRDRRPRVADLGISSLEESPDSVMGTPGYMSPERIAGERCDHRDDIYALGVTLFQMLTGAPPFAAANTAELLRKHLQEPPPLPHTLLDSVDPGLSQVVVRFLCKLPADRPRDYDEVRELLAPFTRNSERLGRPTTRHSSGMWGSLLSLFGKGEPHA